MQHISQAGNIYSINTMRTTTSEIKVVPIIDLYVTLTIKLE